MQSHSICAEFREATMRQILKASVVLVCTFVLNARADAAVVQGRVVDSDGRPVADAEVRILQLERTANGVGHKPLRFDGQDRLTTDVDGRFTSPDVVADDSLLNVIVESRGILAADSGWNAVAKDATVEIPDIVVRRLRAVVGRVVALDGQPVAEATVFNSGEGQQRVETKTGRNGKFFLEGAPEGDVFLFAEKHNYRFSGIVLRCDERDAVLTLAAIDDKIEPLATLPPQFTREEELALARGILDPWLSQTLASGNDVQKRFALAALSHLDAPAALKQFDALKQNNQRDAASRGGLVQIAISQSASLAPEEIRRLVESGDDDFTKVYCYISAARRNGESQRPSAPDWLDSALRCARAIDDSAQRTQALASVADALLASGERERGETVLAEAEKLAEPLAENTGAMQALGVLALAMARSDPDGAIRWLDTIKSTRDFERRAAQLVLRLAPGRPQLAEEVWRRAAGPAPASQSAVASPYLADLCYRLAAVDPVRAERVAQAAENRAFRVRGELAIALKTAETRPAAGRARLRSLVREELPRLGPADASGFRSWSAAATVACALPIAERFAPDLCHEVFWRSLALRQTVPPRGRLHDHDTTDLDLAKMLARYDRDVARVLVQRHAARLPPLIALLAKESKSLARGLAPANIAQPIRLVQATSAQPIREVIAAATYVDPKWAKELLGGLPLEFGPFPLNSFVADGARQAFVWSLAVPYTKRWDGKLSGFWQPDSDDGPLQ